MNDSPSKFAEISKVEETSLLKQSEKDVEKLRKHLEEARFV